jgi:hypothetical protein
MGVDRLLEGLCPSGANPACSSFEGCARYARESRRVQRGCLAGRHWSHASTRFSTARGDRTNGSADITSAAPYRTEGMANSRTALGLV